MDFCLHIRCLFPYQGITYVEITLFLLYSFLAPLNLSMSHLKLVKWWLNYVLKHHIYKVLNIVCQQRSVEQNIKM